MKKCKSCGDSDCAINAQGLCIDCATENERDMEVSRAQYEENETREGQGDDMLETSYGEF